MSRRSRTKLSGQRPAAWIGQTLCRECLRFFFAEGLSDSLGLRCNMTRSKLCGATGVVIRDHHIKLASGRHTQRLALCVYFGDAGCILDYLARSKALYGDLIGMDFSELARKRRFRQLVRPLPHLVSCRSGRLISHVSLVTWVLYSRGSRPSSTSCKFAAAISLASDRLTAR